MRKKDLLLLLIALVLIWILPMPTNRAVNLKPNQVAIKGENVAIDVGKTHILARLGKETREAFLINDGMGIESAVAHGMFLSTTPEQAQSDALYIKEHGECDVLTLQVRNQNFTRLVLYAANADVENKIRELVEKVEAGPVIELVGRKLDIREHTFQDKPRHGPSIAESFYLVDDIRIIKETVPRKSALETFFSDD